jgi:hypothetical protein
MQATSPGQLPAQDPWFDNVDISYKLHADKLVPANLQDLAALVNFLVGKNAAAAPARAGVQAPPPPPPAVFQGRYAAGLVTNLRDLPAKLTSSMTATISWAKDPPTAPAYCVTVTKSITSSGDSTACPDLRSNPADAAAPSTPSPTSKQSAPTSSRSMVIVNLMQNAQPQPRFLLASYHPRFFFAENSNDPANAPARLASDPSQTGNTPTTPSGGNQKQTTAAPANCDSSTSNDPATNKTVQKPCTLTQTITDEGLYHWDVSIAVPTPGYKEAMFDSTNSVVPKSVTQTNAYAMLDIAPWGEDFVKPQLFGIPHLMTGLPISGKVFDKPFVGGLGEEVGLTKIFPFSARVFAGVVYNKEFRGAAQTPHRVWKVQYGIEFSVTSAISKLKGSSGNKSN